MRFHKLSILQVQPRWCHSPGDHVRLVAEEVLVVGIAVAAVVMIDDIAATGKSLSRNFMSFVTKYHDLLRDITVRVVCLVATEYAQESLLRIMDGLNLTDCDFRACQILGRDEVAFPKDLSGWPTEEQYYRAKALSTDLGSRIYKNSPLGYGGMGLLVVFPTTVPNNSLPILHSRARAGSSQSWEPLFPRLVN